MSISIALTKPEKDYEDDDVMMVMKRLCNDIELDDDNDFDYDVEVDDNVYNYYIVIS